MIYKKLKAQVSLEIIILIAILLVVAIALAVIFLDFSGKSIESTTDTVEGTEDVTDNFVKDFNTAISVIYIPQNASQNINPN
ncbi:MAG: hypothetical protein WCF78_03515 [archaeon]